MMSTGKRLSLGSTDKVVMSRNSERAECALGQETMGPPSASGWLLTGYLPDALISITRSSSSDSEKKTNGRNGPSAIVSRYCRVTKRRAKTPQYRNRWSKNSPGTLRASAWKQAGARRADLWDTGETSADAVTGSATRHGTRRRATLRDNIFISSCA